MAEILYEKIYPKRAEHKPQEEEAKCTQKNSAPRAGAQNMQPIPGRELMKVLFIHKAMTCSQQYALDCTITEEPTRVVATLALDGNDNLPEIKKLIEMADELMFLPGNGRDARFTLYLYTHGEPSRYAYNPRLQLD